MSKLTEKELNRLSELENKAEYNYIQHSDLEHIDWLDTKGEREEFKKLQDKFFSE